MAQVSFEKADKANEGGGRFFKLSSDESKQVRFLWDRWEEVEKWIYQVHEITNTTPDGKRTFSTIDCPVVEGVDKSACKYCSRGEVPVYRVIIPLFNVEEGRIQYWKRSYKWLTSNLKPVLDEVTHLPSIANQTFKIKRTGSDMQSTSYNVVPVMNSSDARTKADFGEVENPYDSGLVRRYGEEDNQSQQGQSQQGFAPQAGYQPRRTTEVF